MHGLHNFEASGEVLASVLCAAQGGSKCFEGVEWGVECGLVVDLGEAPCVVVLLKLLCRGVNNDVGLCAVAYASPLRVLAGCVDGVDDCVNEAWVADDRLVIHEPDVNDAPMWVYGVKGVLGVLLGEKGTSFARCHLGPLGPLVDNELPCRLKCSRVRWSVASGHGG